MLYSLLRSLAVFLLKLLFRIEVKGRENIPSKGPFIIASNHLSNIDPVVLGVACRRKLNFLAKEELFKIPLFSSLILQLGALPLKREGVGVSALKESIKKLREAKGLVIFPEGTRLKSKKKIYEGIGFLVNKAKVQVIPAKIYNTDRVLPPGKFLPSFKKIKVCFGQPLGFPPDFDSRQIAQQVLKEIESL